MVFVHILVNGIGIGNVEFVNVGVEIVVLWVVFFEQLYFVTQLAIAACDKDIHDLIVFKFQTFSLVFDIIIREHPDESGDFFDGMFGVGCDVLFLQTQEHRTI